VLGRDSDNSQYVVHIFYATANLPLTGLATGVNLCLPCLFIAFTLMYYQRDRFCKRIRI